MNGFFFYRTYQKYGNIIPVSETAMYKNSGNPIKNIYQNAVRNLWLHAPDIGYDANKYVYYLAQVLLFDEMNNPDNTWAGTSFAISHNRHEDLTGNNIHILLIVFSLIFIYKIRKDISWPLISSIVIGFLLFCLTVKWQPWGSRLQLPLFILSCPMIASFIYNSFDRQAAIFIMVVLFVFAMPYLFKNCSRNLLSFDWLNKTRNELMFNNNPAIYNNYCLIAASAGHSSSKYIDIRLKSDQYEYPLWVMTGKKIK